MPRSWLTLLCLLIFSWALPSYAWKMEAGKVNLSSTSGLSQLETHNFQQIYDSPPIVIALATSDGSNAGAVRISNITTSGFRMSSVEPNSEDGPHAAMTVSYIAIDAGTHTLDNGEIIEAGNLITDKIQFNGNPNGRKQFETLNYANSFSSPVLIAAIQSTFNEKNAIPDEPSDPWLTVAVDNITNTQADIALERSEVFDRQTGSTYQFDALSGPEDIGYVIMDRDLIGNFRASGNLVVNFETLYTTNRIDGWSNGCDAINFNASYSSAPIVLATKSSRNEIDGGWLRECSVSASQIQLTIDEDDAQDNERSHGNEDASLLIFSDSFFYDSEGATSLPTSNNLMLESGAANLTPSQFTTINFEQIYEYPPAVFILEDDQNPEPSSVRIRNITEQSFEVVPVEPDSRVSDAADQTTRIHYMAITKGEFQFPDGKKIEIGPVVPPNEIINFQSKLLSGDSWFSFNFASNFDSTPAFLSQIQSMNNEPSHLPGSPSAPWFTTAARNINSTGGEIALDRAETNTGAVTATEEIAYIVTNPGVIGEFNDAQGNIVSSEAQATPNSVAGTRSCDTYNFLQTYSAPPLVVGSQMTWDGGDGGWLRRCSTSNTQLSIKIEEDWAVDTDNAHTTERAGFLAFSDSFYADFSLVANYQLEGPLWTNSANEIIDSSNSGLNGQAFGDARAFPAKVCNGGDFDGDGDFIEIPDSSALDINDELTVMTWIKPSVFPTTDLMTIVSKDTNFEFHLDPSGKVVWWWNASDGSERSFSSNATNVSIDNWHHVAITYSKSLGSQKIYIDGIETNSTSFSNESLINNNLPMYIGTDYNYPTRDFNGSIDEVKVFKRALPMRAIQKYAAETRPCNSCVLDSFEISQPSYALACPDTRAEIEITAKCVDGSTKTDYTGSLNLSGPSGSLFYDAQTGGAVINTLNYVFSDSGIQKAYLYFDNESTSVQVSAEDTAASVLSTASSGTDFRAFGFKVSQEPSSFACGSSSNMTLTAYGKTNNGSGSSCEVITGFSGDKRIDTWFRATLDNDNTADTIAQALSVNGIAISEQAINDLDKLQLNFLDGESNLNLTYPNAAQFLDLNFRFNQSPYDGSEFNELAASTGSFVVHPSHFSLIAESGTTPLSGSSNSSSTTHPAGTPFSLSATAQCADNSTATDYQPINSTNTIMTYLQRVGPVGGNSVAGTMPISASKILTSKPSNSPTYESASLSATDFTNGVFNYAGASYSEVGLTRLYLKDINYFGEEIPERSLNIGRFIPSYFSIDVSNGRLLPFCNIGSAPDFSYTGQTIFYDPLALPGLTIKAFNSQDSITQNYTENGFLKLNTLDTNILRTFPSQDKNQTGLDGINRLTLSSIGARPISFSSVNGGIIEYEFSNADMFTYTKNANALVSPFNSGIEIRIDKVVDADLVEANAAPYAVSPNPIEFRYGRWAMDNAYGPEIEHLIVPVRTEYWDGTSFRPNLSDNCSTYEATNISMTPSLSGGMTAVSGNGTLIFGESPLGSSISLSAPGSSNIGTVDLVLTVDEWLRFDWDNNAATPDSNPSATASFGQYRGHDRIIYWREIHN